MLKQTIDKNGNIVSLLDTGVCELKLVNENKIRVLGKIEDRILKVFRPFNHLHYKTNSIGFNAELIENDFGFDFIELEFRGNKYFFSKDTLVKNCFHLRFFANNNELQKFLKMEIIEKYLK